MTVWIAVLLGVSAAGELFGTVTVWRNYAAGASLASQIQREVGVEHAVEDWAIAEDRKAQAAAGLEYPLPTVFSEVGASITLRDLREQIGGQLQSTWLQTAGLWAYVVGAVTGLAAGYLALFH